MLLFIAKTVCGRYFLVIQKHNDGVLAVHGGNKSRLRRITSEMKRIVNSRVKRGPQLLGKSLAVLDFEGDLLAANTLKLTANTSADQLLLFRLQKRRGKRRARSGAGSKFRCTFNQRRKTRKAGGGRGRADYRLRLGCVGGKNTYLSLYVEGYA